MSELDRAGYTCAKAYTVIGAENIIVHGLRDRDDVHAFVVKALAVAERVVATDRDQHVDADVLEILEHVLRNVVDLFVVSVEMRWNSRFRQMTGAGAGRM